MGFSFGNAIAAVEDQPTRACLMRLGRSVDANEKTLSTFSRNADLLLGADPTASVGIATVNGVASTFMRSDAAPQISQGIVPTWTGVHTFSAQDVHNAGVSLGTSGRLNSAVVDGASAVGFLIQPTNALTTSAAAIFKMLDSTGTYGFQMNYDNTFTFLGSAGSNLSNAHIVINQALGSSAGINFSPTMSASSGANYGKSNSIVGAQFVAKPATDLSPSGYIIGGFFGARTGIISSGNNPTGFLGALFRGGDTMAANSGKTFAELGGWRTMAPLAAKNAGTFTDVYGGYIENQTEALSGVAYINLSGLIIEEMTGGGTINNGIQFKNATAGYKAITIRDQNAWIGSAAAGEITIGGTNFRCASTNQAVFGVAVIARPTNAIAAAAFVANTSGIVNDTATWGGYTAGQVVQALQNYGILT
jgi:hypothetical protein